MAVLGSVDCIYCRTLQKDIEVVHLDLEGCLGAIMWKDKGAKKYSQLLLIAICALYAGLAMDMRMCRFACIILPPLSLYLINRLVTSCRGASEKKLMVGKLWMMGAAMVLFFNCQHYAGMWRVWMLVVSIAMVAYICWRTFGKQGMVGINILATIYLGIFLPSLSIGYNQYACIEYGRRGLYTLDPLRGVFYIKDAKTDKVGLRDRYSLLVEPEYDNIVHNTHNRPLGIYELRNNGCYTFV